MIYYHLSKTNGTMQEAWYFDTISVFRWFDTNKLMWRTRARLPYSAIRASERDLYHLLKVIFSVKEIHEFGS